jgi:archaeosine synthase beta-subunit
LEIRLVSIQLSDRYPDAEKERDRWILSQRTKAEPGGRGTLDPLRPVSYLLEEERSDTGDIVTVATLFLTNRECPWRCLMCDLWQNTLTESGPAGAIPAQIDYALDRLSPARQIKLYNSGSFFDRRAIPIVDHEAIAARIGVFERVIVESHPALIGDDCFRFRDLLNGRLEVAMGLETVNPEALERLNKNMTLDQFSRAAELLRANDISLRAFILVKPPFVEEDDALYWAERSLDFAFNCGATVAVLIPTRTGNGAMEELMRHAQFSPPRLSTLESAVAYGVRLERGRVFSDLWDLKRIADCDTCFAVRAERLRRINLNQQLPPAINCRDCL